MVRGIEKFREYFAGYEENYVIIGGAEGLLKSLRISFN